MYIYLIGKLNSTEKKMKSKKCFQEYLFTSDFQLPFCCECIVISQNDSLQEKQIILIWIFFNKDFSCYQWIGDLLLSSSIFISIPYWVIHRYIMNFFSFEHSDKVVKMIRCVIYLPLVPPRHQKWLPSPHHSAPPIKK